jgi:hypothetical protein
MRLRSATVLAVVIVSIVAPTWARAADPPAFAECLAPEDATVTVGVVECQRVDSTHLGAQAPFTYYVPEACNPETHPGIRCPAIYLTHGTGGSYRSSLGPKGGTAPAWAKALTFAPPQDAATAPEPWTMGPSTWVSAQPLPFVFIAPHNRTLPGGYGPAPDMDGLWSDWNPRYALGGDSQQYATPPPRFDSFVVEELLPFVESHLPVGTSRGYRATIGHSQGGFGALKFPLAHPDLFTAAGSQSGGSLPFGKLVRLPNAGVGVQPPVPVPHTRLPGITPMLDYPPETNYLVIPSLIPGYGDPVADATYYEAEFPSGISENGRAFANGRQAIAFRLTVGDAIPRRLEDITTDPQGYASSQGYELLTFVATHEMARALAADELAYELQVHPGLHGGPYQAPHYRNMLLFMWRNMLHPDGSGDVVTEPEHFDFRTIKKSFEVWGWRFEVAREPTEFLNLTNVSCNALTLRGTGTVSVTVPERCGTGLGGDSTFQIDLGPQQATDQPHQIGAYPVYGRTMTVGLTPL